MTNPEIAKKVMEAMEADTEHEYDVTFERLLDDLDLSRQDETNEITEEDLQNIIDNCKQAYETAH